MANNAGHAGENDIYFVGGDPSAESGVAEGEREVALIAALVISLKQSKVEYVEVDPEKSNVDSFEN